ncbi:MAG: hypothetical protein U0U70_08250 [Chitinophagaceae bacterium]
MKTKIRVTLILLINTLLATAQHTGRLTVLAGASVPAGVFAQKDITDPGSGFAKTGEAMALQYSHPVSKKWNLLIFAAAQRNPLHVKAFENGLSAVSIGQNFYFGSTTGTPPPPGHNYYKNWIVEKRSWFAGSLHAGMEWLPGGDSKKSWFSLSGAVGAGYVLLPHVKGSSITDTATAVVEQTKETAFGFSYHTAAGFHYRLTKNICLSGSLLYYGTGDVTFKEVRSTTYTTRGVYGSPGYTVSQSFITFRGQQRLGTVCVLAGISFRL